jgi:ferredoxin-NADP reductase
MIKPIKFESEVIEVSSLTPTVKSIFLSVPSEFIFEPGQYVNIIVTMPDGHIERRSYSIASASKGVVEICVDKVENGRVSPMLHELKKGHRIQVQGPLGVFVLKNNSKEKDNIFVAVGTGITPFVAMIPYLLQQTKKKVILIDGYRHENEVLYKDVFSLLEKKHLNFKHYTVISKPSESHKGDKGHVQQLIEKHIPHDFEGDFYLCGLFNMIKEVGMLLTGRKVNKDRIIFERYD